jgi:dsDNA-specific endonuclease/ATPase MutS2
MGFSFKRAGKKKPHPSLEKQYCLELPLAKNFEEALILQNQTSEAYDIIDKEGSLPLGGLRNIKKSSGRFKKRSYSTRN